MDLSGIIFVVLALAWAVFLIPKALKHHDEIARTRSIDRFSTAMRVLARREPVDRRSARLVVTPARSSSRVVLPKRPEPTADNDVAPTAGTRPQPIPAQLHARRASTRRSAARAAARRRRRVLLLLTLADVVVAALAGLAILLWWAVAVPVGLTVAYLVACRTQVRHENDSSWTRTEPESSEADQPQVAVERSEVAGLPRRAIRVDAAYGTPQHVAQDARETGSPASAEFSPDEETVQIPMAELQTVAVTVETVDGGSLWDPLPVTLPTYVGKARAPRTVRTIDLTAAGTWNSGHDVADSRLVEESAAAADDVVVAEDTPRAVGT